MSASFIHHLTAFWLILQCGSDDYRVREEATQGLLCLSKKADIYEVILLGASSKDSETARRCRMVARRYEGVVRPTVANYYPDLSLMDGSEARGYRELTRPILEWYRLNKSRIPGKEMARLMDWKLRMATLDYVRLMLKAGYTREEIVQVLDDALEQEKKDGRPRPSVGPEGWW